MANSESWDPSAVHQATPIAVAVVESAGRFLVGQRPAGVPLAGLWEFPGGKIEPGETPAQAAARECLEEAGLAVEIIGSYPAQVERYDHGTVQLFFLACRPLDPSRPPAGLYRWVARSDLRGLDFPAGNRSLIDRLCSSGGTDSAEWRS
jgi:mutator protein MutT